MISINDTLNFIKRRIGYPNVSIELSDEDIVEVIKHEALMKFEEYVPDVGRVVIPKGSKKYRIKKNLYWIIDKQDREVIAVQSIEPEESELLANSYPYTVPIASYDNISDTLETMNKAHISMQYGRTLKWWQESIPNQVWIFSDMGISGKYDISYTRSHAPDLSSISREYGMDFMNIALAYTLMNIGNIRSKYGSLSTPVGDLSINTEFYSQGEGLLNSTIEALDKKKPIFCQLMVM